MKKSYIPLIMIAFALTSCGNERIDTAKVKKELEKYKIKKISQGEILSNGEEIGLSVINNIQNGITQKLDSSLAKGDLETALSYCILSNNTQIAEFEKKYEAKISRAGFSNRLRNPKNGPDSTQTLVLEGYNYAKEKGMSFNNDVFSDNTQLTVNAPVLLTKSCLPCHGIVGKDIKKTDYPTILSKYPNDKSTGFKLNEPMGVWTIVLDKSFVIRNVEENK